MDLKLDWKLHEDTTSAAAKDCVQGWMDEVHEVISSRSLPLAMKLQQVVVGKGTYIVNNEDSRAALLSKLKEIMEFSTLVEPLSLTIT